MIKNANCGFVFLNTSRITVISRPEMRRTATSLTLDCRRTAVRPKLTSHYARISTTATVYGSNSTARSFAYSIVRLTGRIASGRSSDALSVSPAVIVCSRTVALSGARAPCNRASSVFRRPS